MQDKKTKNTNNGQNYQPAMYQSISNYNYGNSRTTNTDVFLCVICNEKGMFSVSKYKRGIDFFHTLSPVIFKVSMSLIVHSYSEH